MPLTSTLDIPNLIWLADADEVRGVVMDCPLTETITCDVEHHRAIIEYTGEEALETILRYLDHAGYPATLI